jgi:hypothetical protein
LKKTVSGVCGWCVCVSGKKGSSADVDETHAVGTPNEREPPLSFLLPIRIDDTNTQWTPNGNLVIPEASISTPISHGVGRGELPDSAPSTRAHAHAQTHKHTNSLSSSFRVHDLRLDRRRRRARGNDGSKGGSRGDQGRENSSRKLHGGESLMALGSYELSEGRSKRKKEWLLRTAGGRAQRYDTAPQPSTFSWHPSGPRISMAGDRNR